MSNLDLLTKAFKSAQQSNMARNLNACIGPFASLCKEMSDNTLNVTIDPDLSTEQTVCFLFRALTGKSFQSRINISFEIARNYAGGYFPILSIPGETQKYSLSDPASITRSISPIRTYAANRMARDEAQDLAMQAWKKTFPSVP